MATEYELTLTDYLSIVRHRAPYMVGVFVVALLITIVVAIAMPRTYRSTGTIMVESQHVPDSVVPTAAKALLDERISIIMQRVMTRESLLKIANKYSIFKESAGVLSTSELIDKMRDRITVEMVEADTARGSRAAKSTIAFTLSFDDRRPEIAHQVAKDIAALFLDWNAKLRTEGATETATFLTQESDKLRIEVERLDGRIAEYKKQNSGNLPEQLSLHESALARTGGDLYDVEREIRVANETLHSLKADMYAANANANSGGDDPSQTLPKLKAILANLTSTYTESHPDVRALKRRIDALEQESAKPEPKAAPVADPSQAGYKIQVKIDATQATLESLLQQRKMLQGKIFQNEQAIARTPLVAGELGALVRERDNVQKKYEELLNKQANAKLAQNLESENKSERFLLLEPPLLPEKAFKPDRVKIFVLGFFLAIVSAGVAAMILESIDKRIRGVEALTHVLGCRPLVVIPYLTTQEEAANRKRMIKLGIIAAVVAIIAAIAMLHFLYMPLDTLFMKIMARF